MKVLVVDDREENRLILTAKLRAAGFDVRTASNGIDAMKLLRAELPDLVITDLMMPHMDGYQMTHAIKTDDALKYLPILVYPATYVDAKDEALALNLGANGFVRKPAADEEFFRAIDAVVAQAARGELVPRTPTTEELTYLRQYSERLIQKLEDKVEELEQAERKLRDLNATLEQRVKDATAELREVNQELEAFAYSVSHDLRSPLRSIQGFATALLSTNPPPTDEERAEFTARIEKLSRQGQVLINDLLEYARLKSAQLALSPVPLREAVEAALERIDADVRARATIDVHNVTSVVQAHSPTLIQAVQNLLSNALKFTRPGETPRVVVTETQNGSATRLNIQDNGIGVPPEFRDRIFKVFERLHSSAAYPGTGVGLAIVQRAVQKMHGEVGVESEAGHGSTFWIKLPRAS
jgi:signal transduction histidine kinase